MPKIKLGRQSIFRDKKGGSRVQGVMTKAGTRAFANARKRLATLADREPENVSDADVIEFMARGEAETVLYLAATTFTPKKS